MAEFAHVVNEFDDWELLYCPYCGHNLIGPEDGGGGLRTRPCDHVLFVVDSEGGFQHLGGLAVQKLTENGATVEVGKFDCFVEFADVDEDDFLTTSEQVDRVRPVRRRTRLCRVFLSRLHARWGRSDVPGLVSTGGRQLGILRALGISA